MSSPADSAPSSRSPSPAPPRLWPPSATADLPHPSALIRVTPWNGLSLIGDAFGDEELAAVAEAVELQCHLEDLA